MCVHSARPLNHIVMATTDGVRGTERARTLAITMRIPGRGALYELCTHDACRVVPSPEIKVIQNQYRIPIEHRGANSENRARPPAPRRPLSERRGTVILVLRSHRTKVTSRENRRFGRALCDHSKGHSFSTQNLAPGPKSRSHLAKYPY